MSESITIDVVYPLPQKQEIFTVSLPAGSTLFEAVEASGVMKKYPEIDLAKDKPGVYAKLAKPDAPLRDRDRIEIYHHLIADPKEVRKQRAAQGKVMKKGVGETEGD